MTRFEGLVMLAAPVQPNLPEVAGYYSQLAGVLASFSFAGLVALMTTRQGGDGPSARWRGNRGHPCLGTAGWADRG